MSQTRQRVLAGLVGAAALIAVMTVLSRVVGFGRWFAHSYAVGGTLTGEAYATANQLPNVMFEVVAGGALAGAVIPLLAGPLARRMGAEADQIASALLTWAVLVLVPVSLVLALAARPLVALMLPVGRAGVDPEASAATVDLAARLLVIFAPQVVLYGVGVVLTGVLQARKSFLWPAAAPLASSLVVIASYLVFRELAQGGQSDPGGLSSSAIAWLGWGTTAGVAAMSLPLMIPVLRGGTRLRPTLRFPPGVAGRARQLALAGAGGLVAQQVAVLATLRLANANGDGGAIALFQYAQAVYVLPYAVLAVPLATAAFPTLAERSATGDTGGYARLVALSTRAVLAVSALGAAALVALSPAVAQVFAVVDASGDPERVAAIGPALVALAPGLVGLALVFHLSRVLYAVERARSALVATSIGWGAVVVASIVAVALLVPEPDTADVLVALGVGSSVGMTVGGVGLVIAVSRAVGSAALGGLGRTCAVVLAAALAGALSGRWLTLVVQSQLDGVAGALTGAVSGGALACVVVIGVLALAERSTLQEWRASRRRGTATPTGTGDAT